MTTAEQADRTARNVLELVQLRRRVAAVRTLHGRVVLGECVVCLETAPCSTARALDGPLPTPQALDPEEVPA